jgi:hypothetical protein
LLDPAKKRIQSRKNKPFNFDEAQRMKALALTLLIAAVAQASFGQGKISFANDALHLVYDSETGQAISSVNMPGGATLVADLYMGTSSGALYLYSTTTFSSTAGQWNPASVIASGNATTGAPLIFGGTTAFVLAQIRNAEAAPEHSISAAELQAGSWAMATSRGFSYIGWSQEFTFILGAGVTYPPMYSMAGNWASGTYNLDQYGAGSRGAIDIAIPEPSFVSTVVVGSTVVGYLGRRRIARRTAV